MEIFQSFSLTAVQWIWVIIAAFLVGFSKTGISGLTMLVIPIIATIFGGKESTGILLPMLIIGDFFAVYYYKRHAEWRNVKKPLPWALGGIVLGVIVGNYVNDSQFKAIMAVSIIICIGILIYMEKKGENLKVPKGAWFHALTGTAAGFTTMIGNAAGPIFSIYLLTMGFKKNNYMGTSSWFFMIINLSKVPLQVFFWNNISLKTTVLAFSMIPIITVGALLGSAVIKRLNEKPFRYLIIAMTVVAAVRLLM